MPAPMPINIRYGSPADLLNLAGQTGIAQNNMDMYKQQYQGWLQRMGMDQSFLENEMNRRQADSHFTQQLQASQSRDANQMAMAEQNLSLKDAYNQSLLALKERDVSGDQAIAKERADTMAARLEAQKSGAIGSSRGRSSANLDLVNPDGTPYVPPQPESQAVMTSEDGTTTEMYKGVPITYNATDAGSKHWARSTVDEQSASETPASAPMTRAQFMQEDRQKAARENLEFTQGQINTRSQASLAARKSGQTYSQKQDEKIADTLRQTEALMGALPAQRMAWAQARMGPDGVYASDQEKLDYFNMANLNAKTILGATQRPVTNSNGTTPTGGNPVPVTNEAEFAALPPGTIVVFPDGRTGRRP